MAYKEVRNRNWFSNLYSIAHANQDYSLVDVEIDIKHLNTAALDWIETIEDGG